MANVWININKIFLIFTAFFLLAGCDQNIQKQDLQTDNNNINSVLKLGFCPTMKKDALALQENNPNIELKEFASAEIVLHRLKTDKINLALIGRKAEKSEIAETIIEKNLEKEEKHTLISGQKQMINEKDLPNMIVKTCLDKSIKDQFPELNLVFQQTCNYLNGEVWLISWSEFIDEMELLIPMNEMSEKVRKFRNAFLYAKDSNSLIY